MRRLNLLAGLGALAMLVGCNTHPVKIVEYSYFTGEAPEDPASTDGFDTGEDTSSSMGDGDGDGDGDETGTGTSMGDDAGEETGMGDDGIAPDLPFECGNGIVEGEELCDDGENNGLYPAPCGEDCSPNLPT